MSPGTRILVAMSGGVDSATAAALLKRQGHEVIGVGLKLHESQSSWESERSCCGIAAMDDARRVASHIGIPFYVLNYERLFEDAVIDYFCRSYLDGKTPNPCVECNRVVKFGHLLRLADALDADYVATGHYARVSEDRRTGRYLLRRGADPQKDQSYFLYSLSQQQLCRALFPLGEMTKEETRDLARSFGLEVCDKPASQDVCFVGSGGYRQFLVERFPEALRRGPIVNTRGEVMGEHSGIACYTVGQRKGVGVAAGVPLYVLAVDGSAGTVVVGGREELQKRRVCVDQVTWIPFEEPSGPVALSVKTRYRAAAAPATVSCRGEGRAEVVFITPQTAVAPGQSAVFYDGEVVVGGGIVR